MPLEPLRIIKNWYKNLKAREECWDEIADKVTAFSSRVNNNLKQVGLDIGGSSYDFNNNGVKTQTTPITTRLSSLESVEYSFGVRNLGLDLSDPAKVKLVAADGTDLSSSNKGFVTFNSTANAGQVVTRGITSNMELTLTGAHWGFGTSGDLSDQILWIMLLDTGSQAILGVGAQGGRQTVTQADDETVATSVNAIEKVFVSSALSAENNCIYLGYVKADFDDTGNVLGEDYWSIQTGVGDVNLGRGESSKVDERITGNLSVGGSATITTATITTANITTANISGTGSHTISNEFANDSWEAIERETGTSVGVRGVAISDECTSFSGNSASYVDVTNLSVTITTTGRPVRIELIPADVASSGYVGAYTTGYDADSIIGIVRDASTIAVTTVYIVQSSDAAEDSTRIYVPPGAVTFIDAVAAGTYTYKIQVKRVSGSYLFNHVKLVAYEL